MPKLGDMTRVGVILYINKEGKRRPLYIVWEDDETGNREKFKIEKITDYAEVIPGHFVWIVVIKNQLVSLHNKNGEWYTVRGVTSIWIPQ